VSSYASQCVYSTQETIVPDVPAFARAVGAALRRSAAHGGSSRPKTARPIFILDGYHGFGAIPTDLAHVPQDEGSSEAAEGAAVEMIYVSGLLKHVGSGANCAFMVLPPALAPLRPLLTGWLADPSVLSAESAGIKMGSEVGYMDRMGPDMGLSLMGSTPAFAPSLLIFNEVMERWVEHAITVPLVHAHVMRLHTQFLSGLQRLEAQAAAAAPGDRMILMLQCPVLSARELGLFCSHDHSCCTCVCTPKWADIDLAGTQATDERGTRAQGGIASSCIHSLLAPESRSHTLVFDQPDAARAKQVVRAAGCCELRRC
jgi:hypothetical protein